MALDQQKGSLLADQLVKKEGIKRLFYFKCVKKKVELTTFSEVRY